MKRILKKEANELKARYDLATKLMNLQANVEHINHNKSQVNELFSKLINLLVEDKK